MFVNLSSDAELAQFKSSENFELAWNRVLSSPILDTKDRLGLRVFSALSDDHLDNLRRDVCDGAYEPSDPYFLLGPKADRIIRVRTFLDIRDRIIFQALGNVIIENCYNDIEPYANKSIFAHIPTPKLSNGDYSPFTFLRPFTKGKNKGQYEKFVNAVHHETRTSARKQDVWMLEVDIASFYPSIDHNLIVEMLRRRGWLKNDTLLDLLAKCLHHWSAFVPGRKAGQGVPIGYEASELLATLFLLDIDLQLELHSRSMTMMRFVDDMYFFICGRQNARNFLVEYDFALQKRSLVRNSSKTKLSICDDRLTDESKSKLEIRSKISFIQNVPVAMLGSEDDEEVEEERRLLKLLHEDIPCMGECDENDIECIQSHASMISFILWRLEKRVARLKRIAICVLTELPNKSIQAAKYLSLFSDDVQAYEALLVIAERATFHPACQVDCMKYAIEMDGELTARTTDILLEWLAQNDDWYVKDAAIDFLADHGHDLSNAIDRVSEDHCYLTVNKVLYRRFNQLDDVTNRVEIINLAFAQEHYMTKSLGIYLFRRDPDISREHLNSTHLPDELEQMILTTRDIADFTAFAETFEQIFGFEIQPTNSLFIRRIPDIRQANQALVNLQDADSDPVVYIKALREFAIQFFTAYLCLNDVSFRATNIREVVVRFQGEEYGIISQLRDLGEFADNNDRSQVNPKSRNDIRHQINRVIALHLANYYASSALEIPAKLAAYCDEQRIQIIERNNMLTPESSTITFLIEIGRWAKSELSERWKVRRDQQSADLTQEAEVEQVMPEMLQSAITASNPQRVEEVISLIERKRNAINRARNAKLTHREERERGEITENMFNLRLEREDETIRQMLNEIESDLNDLGIFVEKEPI